MKPYNIAKKILRSHRGTRFVKADLHVHTPASKDWDENNPEPENKSSNITPDQIVQSALSQGLELIAITDHNSVEWCEKVINAAQGTKLTVLPGFELSASLNVHLLAIFEEKKTNIELRNLLVELGITDEQFGNSEHTSKYGIGEKDDAQPHKFKIIEKIKGSGGILIPAHVESTSGVLGRIGGTEDVRRFLRECTLIETVNSEPHQILMELLNRNHREFALIQNSDAHRLEDIGKRSTWLKLDSKSLTSLKQVGFEPQNKAMLTKTDPSKKAHIIGMYSNGGYLGQQVYAFNEDLNCIIGGRGAGKSTLLDYLRFVLGDEPDADDLKDKYHSRLVGLIQNSTTVSVLLEDRNDEFWLCQRQLLCETESQRGKQKIKITSDPATVWFISLEEQQAYNHGQIDLPFSIDFYSQGEVQSITLQAESKRQLRLVDNFSHNSISQRRQRIEELQEKLSDTEKQINDINQELATLKEKFANLPAKKARITEIEASLQSDRWQENQIWEDANNWVRHANEQFIAQRSIAIDIQFTPIEERKFELPKKNDEAQVILNKLLVESESAVNKLIKDSSEMQKQATDTQKKMSQLLTKWGGYFEAHKQVHSDFLRSQGVSNLDPLSEEVAQLKIERDHIINIEQPRLAELDSQIMLLEKERAKKLKKLYREWESLRNCRIAFAKEMTERLKNRVIIKIADEQDTSAYYDLLHQLTPSGTQTSVENAVVQEFSPKKLVQLVREKNVEELVKGKLSDNGANRLLQISEEKLMQLERVYCGDIAQIELELDQKPRPLDTLSDGERCTAILSIILLDEHRPLLIDQPEDELDHDFIMQSIVRTLSEVKQKTDLANKNFTPRTGRQFIIATHDQNIPVLGDAELVIKMKKIPEQQKCEAVSAFGMDHEATIKQVLSLEGGLSAFERRGLKYSSIV